MKQQGTFERHPHHLVIIGGDPDGISLPPTAEMARIKALSKELGIGDLVIFLGNAIRKHCRIIIQLPRR